MSEALKSLGYTVASASLEYLPKSLVSLNGESYESALKLMYALFDHSNVTEVYDNFTLAQETTELRQFDKFNNQLYLNVTASLAKHLVR